MECSICLERIRKDHKSFTLSCNHTIHYQCFLLYVYKTDGHIFINCPLCRKMNTNNEKPYSLPINNIKALCSRGVGRVRCLHKTKKGNCCKNPSSILNYGFCNLHNRSLLPKEKYELMADFMFYLLETSNLWRTKLYMIDIAKKILIQNPEIKSIPEIQYYFFRYFHHHLNENPEQHSWMLNSHKIYEYYDLKLPPKDWIAYCNDKKKII